jgi:hypothetical protein
MYFFCDTVASKLITILSTPDSSLSNGIVMNIAGQTLTIFDPHFGHFTE